MSIISSQDQFVTAQIIELVSSERSKALSKREWKHRLAGYGYSISETDAGDVLETLPHHVKICTLPAVLSA
jgi:hypothetical protein